MAESGVARRSSGRACGGAGTSGRCSLRRVISGVPTLEIGPHDAGQQRTGGEPARSFHYDIEEHERLPHVVKFSGGRSSALLLFVVLESGLLRADRGDVVIFNNTSAEHPETYRFARECKQRVEEGYGIPFFWIEFQTYEDARNGHWTRLPTYRLVQPEPWSERDRPEGYRWKGEVFEELLSWDGYVPNIFQRTCTKKLKLEPTRAFLRDWFADKRGIDRLGHFGRGSRIDDDTLYESHRRNGGTVPRPVLLTKRQFVRSRATSRPAQRFDRFSPVARPFDSSYLSARTCGSAISFGPNAVEYVAFVGLRHDEQQRVRRVRQRNAGGPASAGYEGEHVYMPLHGMGIDARQVETFWNRRRWGLSTEAFPGALSNCAYCFLKGIGVLKQVDERLAGEGDLAGTPSDAGWWIDMEERYGRDLRKEGREERGGSGFIGFFGATTTYRDLASAGWDRTGCAAAGAVRSCDCTD